MFWLDAHHSSGALFKTGKGNVLTPIVSELEHILTHRNAEQHVVLIDDASQFTGKNDYPTIKELEYFVLKLRPNFILQIKEDIIRVHKN